MTRRVRDLIMLVEEVFVHRAKHLMSVAEQIDTNTPMGRAVLTILSAIAQLEREQIAERVQEVLQEKIRRGERAGTIPYGFVVDRNSHRICCSSSLLGSFFCRRSSGREEQTMALPGLLLPFVTQRTAQS